MFFKHLCILVPGMKVASALEGFNQGWVSAGGNIFLPGQRQKPIGLDQAVTESQNCSCQEFSQLSHTASQSYYVSL